MASYGNRNRGQVAPPLYTYFSSRHPGRTSSATAALAHAGELLANVEDIKRQRDRLLAELPELGFPVLPSWTNFVLFGGVDDPQAAFEALLERDILIRDVGIPHHLRVTAGTQAETTAFLAAMAGLAPGISAAHRLGS